MRKTRLYLEASPIIMVSPGQDPVRQAITKEFFRIVAGKTDEYELFVSPATIEEVQDEDSLQFLNSLAYTELPENNVAENLAWIYTIDGVLSQAHIDDLRHVAYAVVSCCDFIVTWNMQHLANDKTVQRVNVVNAIENYGKIFITTPEFFTGGTNYVR